MKKVLIVMGSKNDFDVIRPCIDILEKFKVEYSARVCSAHRTPELAFELASAAKEKGFGVIIGAAGKAAHLAGVMAAHTTLPVIGLPIKSSTMDGLDSLLSTVQMPEGIPVATVAINGGKNAGLLAVQILAVYDERLASAIAEYKSDMAKAVEIDDEKLQEQLKK